MLGKGCLNGCLGKVVLAGVVTGAALAGWRWGPVIFPSVQEWFGGEEETAVEEQSSSIVLMTWRGRSCRLLSWPKQHLIASCDFAGESSGTD